MTVAIQLKLGSDSEFTIGPAVFVEKASECAQE